MEKLSGLVHSMVITGLLDEKTAQRAINDAGKHTTHLVHYLVTHKILTASEIATAVSKEFSMPLFDLNTLRLDVLPLELISSQLIQKHHLIPIFHRHKQLHVAVSDPSDLAAMEEIKFHTDMNVQAVLVEHDKLEKLIEQIVSAKETETFDNISDLPNSAATLEETSSHKDAKATDLDDAPIVRFVNKLILDATKKGASDLHFEPYEKQYRIRFRIDGILKDITSTPVTIANRIAARIKIMARLDISERRIPQDGRFTMDISPQKSIDFRVSTCPIIHGEKIVIRILDSTIAQFAIDALGFNDKQKSLFIQALKKTQGMILVTGPTGSGKTVTLYTALSILNKPEVNILTIEDPVEIPIPGINQVQVNARAGLHFSNALRAFLRQDPDRIMVGEIRDLETAEIAIKASQTGHMVLSTLHTNNAAETLTRLVNMGVKPFNIATSVSLIIAQRLARRLCPRCKIARELPKQVFLANGFKQEEELPFSLHIANEEGCEYCIDGYKGRIGIYEILVISETIGRIIMEGGSAIDIFSHAHDHEKMPSLRESGLTLVREGVTSLEEINRITQD